jgi:WD40 repeat protein
MSQIKLWDDDGNLTQIIPLKRGTINVLSLKLLPNGNLISGLNDGSMVISKLTNGQTLFKWPANSAHSQALNALEIINDFTVASASRDGFIKFWNFLNGTFLSSIQNPNGGVSSLVILNNGFLLSGDEAGLFLIRIWNIQNNTQLNTLSGHTGSVNALELVNSETFASGSTDNSVILWNLTNGQILMTLTASSSSQVLSLKKLTDTTFALGCNDHKIYIWDINTGVNTKTLLSHSNTVEALDLMNDGTILLSGSQDGTFKMWDISSGTLIKTIDTGTPIYSLIHTSDYYKYFVAFLTNSFLYRVADCNPVGLNLGNNPFLFYLVE